VGGDPVNVNVPICRHCNVALGSQQEKALSGEVQWVWASVLNGNWVCPRTGDEHCASHVPCPGHSTPMPEAVGAFIVVEGNPVDGFVYHGIPAFEDHESATAWADENCTESWWIVPLQDVE
jgi:hypothetical protein